MVHETRKILGDARLGVSPTTVRVPVVNGHAESVHAQFHRPLFAVEAKALLRDAEGVRLWEEPYAPGRHPQPVHASGTDWVHVGRIRDDLALPGARICGSLPTICGRARRSTRCRSPSACCRRRPTSRGGRAAKVAAAASDVGEDG